MDIVGIDNDMRSLFFGHQASTSKTALQLQTQLPRYTHHCIDIRNWDAVEHLIKTIRKDLRAVVHTAAQPSHDWAAQAPFVGQTAKKAADSSHEQCKFSTVHGQISALIP